MKLADNTLTDERPAATPAPAPADPGLLTLPSGLMGFEKKTRYLLLATPDEAPFLRLCMVDEPKVTFLVVAPAAVLEEYHPDVSEEDVRFLGLGDASDALVFNIVTVHPDGVATVNMKGPVVVNRQTLVGRQVVPLNAAAYPLALPIGAPERRDRAVGPETTE